MKLKTILHQLLREDAYRDYLELLPKYNPDYMLQTKAADYNKMNNINGLLLKNYQKMPPEAKYQAAMIFKKWYAEKFPNKAGKIKQWNPDSDIDLKNFDGTSVKGITRA